MPTDKKKTKVVICGTTGNQGGAVYHALKDEPGLELVGFSRNVAKAQEKLPNVTILQADLMDLKSLQTAFEGADVVFGVTQCWYKNFAVCDVKAEIEQGKNLVQACVDCKVKHLIYASTPHDCDANQNFVGGESDETGMPHVDSKSLIETLIKKTPGLQYTMIQPVAFMEMVPIPTPNGWIQGFWDADAKMPYISVRDIGLVAKAVVRAPSEYIGKSIPLVGDLVSGNDLAALFTKIRKSETPFRYYAVPRLLMKIFAREMYLMRCYYKNIGRDPKALASKQQDIDNLKKIVPKLSSMEDYLRREGWETRPLISDGELHKSVERTKKLALVLTAVGVAALSIVVGVKMRRH